ncbi:MAG: ribulose-phosphate 3-epimerase [Bacteroidales bacterium]|nr:ribulose-phosphate 3-epimerase [Bacteroidales bacterium]
MMIQVAPSLLSADFLKLGQEVEFLNSKADIIHLDIMDGQFVPNLSFGFPVVEAVSRLAGIPLDVHLMIVQPGKYIERFAAAGASMISFHYEAALSSTPDLLKQIRSLGVKAGIAINPDCPVESIFPYLDQLDFVLVMSVFAGFGGQSFIPASLERIAAIRKALDGIGRKDVPIEVDGGIGPSNAASVVKAGASILVAGSSVFGAPDPAAAISAIRNSM